MNKVPLQPFSPVGRYRVFVVFEADIPNPSNVRDPRQTGQSPPDANLRWLLQQQLAVPLAEAINERLQGIEVTAIDAVVQPHAGDGSLEPVTFGGTDPDEQ